ncbi:hypothetical protein MRX96_031741 [Rhipicephalus microplus]
MKVFRFKVSGGLAIIFHVNGDTKKITHQMLENEHFLQDSIDQDTALTKGVSNTVHYWQHRGKKSSLWYANQPTVLHQLANWLASCLSHPVSLQRCNGQDCSL